jgi:hypothetical protein
LIWLGEATENSPAAFDIAAKLARVQAREDAGMELVDEDVVRDIYTFQVYHPRHLGFRGLSPALGSSGCVSCKRL